MRRLPDSHINLIYTKSSPDSSLRRMVVDFAAKRVLDVINQEFAGVFVDGRGAEEFKMDLHQRFGVEEELKNEGDVGPGLDIEALARRYFMVEK